MKAWFTLVVYPRNTVRFLTLAQLIGIFTGKIKTWNEVGGKSERQILPLLDHEIHRRYWPVSLPTGPRTLLVSKTILKNEVKNRPGSIGWMVCQSPRVRNLKVIAVYGRKRKGKWKHWPISLSAGSLENYFRKPPG